MSVFAKIGCLWEKLFNALRSVFGFPLSKAGPAANAEIFREVELPLPAAAPEPKPAEPQPQPESQPTSEAGEKPLPAQAQPALSPQNFYVLPNDHKTITQPVLAIDMGAAYSKVAFRCGVRPGESFSSESEQLVLDGKALIPSIVVRDPQGQWHFGNIAFGLRPGTGWEVFENWKKALFDTDTPPQSAIIPAVRFLTWLREQVQSKIPQSHEARIRVALPALPNFSRKAFLLRECFVQAGWHQDLFFPVYEPHANIIGLLVKGKNYVFWSDNKPYLQYDKMFKSCGAIDLNQRLYSNRTRSRFMKGMILDIGAYTTDAAPLIIDLEKQIDQYGNGIEAINNFSVRYGISSELDNLLLGELFSQLSFDRARSTPMEIEDIKEAVYGGKKLFSRLGTTEVELGNTEHQQLLSRHLDRFVAGLWPLISNSVAQHKPEWIMLSGGGSCIKRMAEKLNYRIDRAYSRSTPDIDLDNPGQVNHQLVTGLTAWSSTGSGLKRLATSLGATSCLLDVPYAATTAVGRNWLEETRMEQNRLKVAAKLTDCVCKGMNKTCDRCGGTGYRPNNETL